jgi:hypothetical protein
MGDEDRIEGREDTTYSANLCSQVTTSTSARSEGLGARMMT